MVTINNNAESADGREDIETIESEAAPKPAKKSTGRKKTAKKTSSAESKASADAGNEIQIADNTEEAKEDPDFNPELVAFFSGSESEVNETVKEPAPAPKKKSGGRKKSVQVSEVTEGEIMGLDDIKKKIEKEYSPEKPISQAQLDDLTKHLSFSDEEFDELLDYLNNLQLIEQEDIEEDDTLPPEKDDEIGGDFDEDKENTADYEYFEPSDEKNFDPVKQYLHSIGNYTLLTQDQERELAIRIENGNAARAKLAQYDNGEIELTTDEINELYDISEDGQDAKDTLIQCNLKLVISIAKSYVNRGMDFLDLIQEGNLGLIRAVDKFDYTKGFKFSTYATWWIRQAITRALADQARTIRIPVHMVETINKITRAQRKLVQKLNRDPTAEEISEEMGGTLTPEKIREIQLIALDPISLEKPVGEDEESHIADFVEDKETVSPYDYTDRALMTDRINEVLNQLTEREARVIRLRYGLEDGRCHTLEEVGLEFDVTRERIRQIEAKALKKLRHPSRARLLKDYHK